MLLWAFMTATLVVLAGLMYIFKIWMRARDEIMGGNAPSPRSHDHH